MEITNVATTTTTAPGIYGKVDFSLSLLKLVRAVNILPPVPIITV